MVPSERLRRLSTEEADANEYVAVIAAEPREFADLVKRLPAERLRWPVQFAARCGQVIMVANGPGPRLAGRAVSEVMKRVKVRAIVSTGFCGALSPTLGVGDIIVADSVLDPASGFRFRAEQPPGEKQMQAISGPIVSLDRVAVTAGEKDRLRRTGAVAVDMETAVLAVRAREACIPLYCVRAVSDSAGESLAMDFNQYRDREGRFSRWRIAAAALLAPRSIPALRRFDRNCRLAAGRLGEFLADCRF